MLIDNLKQEFEKKQLTIYKASKLTGIKYELLRRAFNEKRRLTAEEFILILTKCGIAYDDIVKCD